jgi:MFS transporter, PPP family, 3-phenylpropionic acid transporter
MRDLPRFFVFFSALYLSFGVASPFLPTFLSSRGLTPEQIGALLSAAGIIRLMAGPVASRLADRLHALRRVLVGCIFCAALFTTCFLASYTFGMLLIVAVLQAAMLAPTTTLADALALRTSRAAGTVRPRFEYGWVRGTGSAAFIIGSLACGQLLTASSLGSALAAQAGLLCFAGIAAVLVPEIGTSHQPAEPGSAKLSALITNKAFLLLVVLAALVLGSHAMHDSFAMVTWMRAGTSPGVGSVLWSEQVAAEVIVFVSLGPWLLRKVQPVHAMCIAAVAGLVRWMVFGVSSSVLAIALVEPLHGLTFALLHLACMRVLVIVTPVALAATAQAVYAVGVGAASTALTFASGFLYEEFGTKAFFAMAVLCVVSIPVLFALGRAVPDLRCAS